MSGEPIKMAVDSLIYFMKSLPPNSKFNIYLFDSSYSTYYPNSVEYNEANVTDALKRIKEERFRFGGTEIYQPLEAVFKSKGDEKYPKVVFLLTDGEISDKERVIHLIKQNSKNCVVNALGIGNGVDADLIKRSAKAGNGYS